MNYIFDFDGSADVIIDFSHHTAIGRLVEYALEKTEKLAVTFDNLTFTDGMARRFVNELYLKRSKL